MRTRQEYSSESFRRDTHSGVQRWRVKVRLCIGGVRRSNKWCLPRGKSLQTGSTSRKAIRAEGRPVLSRVVWLSLHQRRFATKERLHRASPLVRFGVRCRTNGSLLPSVRSRIPPSPLLLCAIRTMCEGLEDGSRRNLQSTIDESRVRYIIIYNRAEY